MKYVVTGGAGFIGSYIVKLLINEGHSVEVIDNLHKGTKKNIEEIFNQINFHCIDIRNKKDVQNVMKGCDGVFHEAALTSAPESFKNPQEYFDVNVKGTENVFEGAKKENLRVVYASSSSIYGNVHKIPIREDSQKSPINPYGKTKLSDEIIAKKYYEEGLEIIGLRYFNAYGKGQTGSYAGVITKFLENMYLNKSLTINGDGNQIRDFIHVKDVARANIISMNSKIKTGFFNVGTGIGTSINNLAKIMMNISKYEKEPIHVTSLDGDVKISQADTDMIFSSLNWSAKIDLSEGLENLIKSGINLNKFY